MDSIWLLASSKFSACFRFVNEWISSEMLLPSIILSVSSNAPDIKSLKLSNLINARLIESRVVYYLILFGFLPK